MNQSEIGLAFGRLEKGIENIEKKLDEAVAPALVRAHSRLDRLEAIVWTGTGILFAGGAGIAVARELFISWLKKKMGLPV